MYAPFTLRFGTSLLRGRHMVVLLLLGIGVPLGGIVTLASAVIGTDAGSMGAIWESLRAAAAEDPGLAFGMWAVAGLLPILLVFLAGQRAAWLRVSSGGLDAYLPKWLGMGLLGQTTGRWSVPWERIRAIRLVTPKMGKRAGRRRLAMAQRIGLVRLVIETDGATMRLSPFPWYHRKGPDHRLGLRELFRLGGNAEPYIERSPLVRAIRERGLELAEAPPADHGGMDERFDLAKHPGMMAQLVLCFGAGLYALLDTFFLANFIALEPIPWWPFVVVIGIAALVVGPLGRGAPRAERLVVALLTVGVLGVAVHPTLLRVNATTAEPEIIEYVATSPGQFRASAGHRPAIDLSGADLDAYWEGYSTGARHPFTLMRGRLGFYQLDLGPLYQRTRTFYRQRTAQQDGSQNADR